MLLDGRVVRDNILSNLRDKLSKINKKLCFVVIYVDSNDISDIYIKSKEKMALELGYRIIIEKLDKNITNDELINIIDKYNDADNVNGIMIELPLPNSIDYDLVKNRINPLKDIEGVNNSKIISPTVMAVMDMLEYYDIDILDKNVVIIGRSNLVGKPLYNLLWDRGINVKLCHSKTDNLVSYTRSADILISCVGKANFINANMIKEGSIVIDIGTNMVDGKLCGDVDFDSVCDKVSYITPVPLGIGQITPIELGVNIYKCYKNIE